MLVLVRAGWCHSRVMMPVVSPGSMLNAKLPFVLVAASRSWICTAKMPLTQGGKDAFDPDFGGTSGFQPMSYSRWAGRCQGLAVAVEDGHGRLVMRSLAVGHGV